MRLYNLQKIESLFLKGWVKLGVHMYQYDMSFRELY